MAQAKTLTQAEIDQVLRFTCKRRYAVRNRALILTSFWSGMRVGAPSLKFVFIPQIFPIAGTFFSYFYLVNKAMGK